MNRHAKNSSSRINNITSITYPTRTCKVTNKTKNYTKTSSFNATAHGSQSHTKQDNCRDANADSGCSGHYIAIKDVNLITNVKIEADNKNNIKVVLPDGSHITSVGTGELNLPHLPEKSRKVHVFDTLHGSLLSIGQFCDAGMTAHYDAKRMHIEDQAGHIVIKGRRDKSSRLWMIDLTEPCPSSQEQQTRQYANALSKQKLDIAGDRVEF